MCGILGIISKNAISAKEAINLLKNLEYRGYDSAGLVTKEGKVVKTVGKVDNLLNKVDGLSSSLFILHTRWATHGKVSERNAHPHFDCEKNIFIVHNGTIDNYEEIKKELKNHTFYSETDSEVFAHFFEQKLKEGKNIKEICKEIFEKFKGTYAVLVYIKNLNKVVALKNGSPLVIGISKDKIFLSSDVYAFSKYTNRVIILEDYNFAEIEV
ncbi:MAG: class II glutamine amidotransferase [Candidatus Aenigmatarchaeota archaeon]